MNPSRLAANMTQLVLWVTEVLLSLRVLLRLFNADATNSIVLWVYSTTAPVLNPFFDVFPQVRTGDGFVIEVVTLFAMAVYAFLGFIMLAVVANYRTKVNTLVGTKKRFNISFKR